MLGEFKEMFFLVQKRHQGVATTSLVFSILLILFSSLLLISAILHILFRIPSQILCERLEYRLELLIDRHLIINSRFVSSNHYLRASSGSSVRHRLLSRGFLTDFTI